MVPPRNDPYLRGIERERENERERERRREKGKMACLCPFHTLLKGTRSFYPSLSVILKYVKAAMIRPPPPFFFSSTFVPYPEVSIAFIVRFVGSSAAGFPDFSFGGGGEGCANSCRSSMNGGRVEKSFSFSRGTRNNLTVIIYHFGLHYERERMEFHDTSNSFLFRAKKKVRACPFFGIGVTRGSVQLLKKKKKKKGS